MYKRFLFEGEIHESLECVPLSVRRKLDLAALKISLEGWQRLPRADRLALCHLPVDAPEDLAVYREFMLSSCERCSVPLKELSDPNAAARAWNASRVPSALATRSLALGAPLSDTTWRELDEETRYALLKLTDPKRNPLKLQALLVELGLALLRGPAPVLHAAAVVCQPEPHTA